MVRQKLSSRDEIIMYVTTSCSDCRSAKAVFEEMKIPYRSINIDEYPGAAQIVEELTNGYQSVPTIVFPDGKILIEPSTQMLQQHLSRYSDKS